MDNLLRKQKVLVPYPAKLVFKGDLTTDLLNSIKISDIIRYNGRIYISKVNKPVDLPPSDSWGELYSRGLPIVKKTFSTVITFDDNYYSSYTIDKDLTFTCSTIGALDGATTKIVLLKSTNDYTVTFPSTSYFMSLISTIDSTVNNLITFQYFGSSIFIGINTFNTI